MNDITIRSWEINTNRGRTCKASMSVKNDEAITHAPQVSGQESVNGPFVDGYGDTPDQALADPYRNIGLAYVMTANRRTK